MPLLPNLGLQGILFGDSSLPPSLPGIPSPHTLDVWEKGIGVGREGKEGQSLSSPVSLPQQPPSAARIAARPQSRYSHYRVPHKIDSYGDFHRRGPPLK